MAPLPDAKHLLELLQRAADELKTSQRETDAVRTEARILQERLAASEKALAEERRQKERLAAQMQDIGSTTLPPGAFKVEDLARQAVKTAPFMKSPFVGGGEKTSVGGDEPGLMGERLAGLQDEIAQLEGDRRDLKEKLKAAESAREEAQARVAALEVEVATPRESPDAQRRLGELEHELSNARQQLIVEQARGADLLTRLHAWEARAQELEQSLASTRQSADDELAQLEQLAGQLSEVETQLTTEKARTQALEEQLNSLAQGSSDEQKKVFEATTRVAQLEVELAGLKGRRDELNVEIGKVENERNAARAKVAELEHVSHELEARLTAAHQQVLAAEHQKRSELEQQVAREKDKHQITAQKLLEARGKQRELEEQVQQGGAKLTELRGQLEARTGELVAQLEAQARAHEAELTHQRHAGEDSLSSLQTYVGQLTQQLETATTEWRHVERQYEQLHREMLVLLDQRDEARRELEALKQH